MQWFLTLPSIGIMAMSRVPLMSLTTSRLQSRQSALFPFTHLFLLTPGTLHPGHCLCVLSHLTSHTLHQDHVAVLYFCLSPHSYYPAQLRLSHLSHSLCIHVSGTVTLTFSPSLLPPPSRLSFKLAKAHVPGGKTVFWLIHIISKVHPHLNSPVSSWEMKQ